jgi:hypothetical protein
MQFTCLAFSLRFFGVPFLRHPEFDSGGRAFNLASPLF